MHEYLKQYIEPQKQFRKTEGDPDSVRALYTFKEKLEQSENKQAKKALVDVYDLRLSFVLQPADGRNAGRRAPTSFRWAQSCGLTSRGRTSPRTRARASAGAPLTFTTKVMPTHCGGGKGR